MYKITLFFINGFEALYPTVDVYVEKRSQVERFACLSLNLGGVWIYDIATKVSQLTHSRNILRAEVAEIDPADVVQTPYVVEAVK